jgi:hypothetical protein
MGAAPDEPRPRLRPRPSPRPRPSRPALPARLSGPVSAFVYDLPSGARAGTSTSTEPHRVYLFGDEHFSYSNMCASPCAGDAACADIVQFIDGQVAAATESGRSIDVFMEFPYLRGERRDSQLRAWDARFRAEASPAHAVKEMLGVRTRVYGIFSLLYRRYGTRFYNHPRVGEAGVSRRGASPAVRFHYADARHEPNAAAMFKGFCKPAAPACDRAWMVALPRPCRGALLAFLTHVPTADRMRELLRAFLFGTDFVADMGRLFGANFRVTRATLGPAPGPKGAAGAAGAAGPRRTHRIAVQFHKLPAAMRAQMRAFLERRIDELCALLRDDLDYDACSRLACDVLTGATRATAAPELGGFAAPSRVRRAQ